MGQVSEAGAGADGSQHAKRFQAPSAIGIVLAENVEVAIVGADFVELIVRAVPLVDDFFDHVVAVSHPESDGPLIGFATGVALHLQLHADYIIAGIFFEGKE